MTINPHLTDQLIAAVAENAVAFPPSIDLAPAFMTMIREELPGADEHVVGEVILHAASLAGRLGKVLEERGYRADAITPLIVTALAGAGASLYRGGGS